jgi:NAD(P)-dependent dehydrogenase (short-subunit alcohol dehydrogenase family)
MPKLDGQVVIITGASAGIGEQTARRLGGGSARVVLAARRRDRLDSLVQEIKAAGGQALAVGADITSADDRAALVDQTVRAFGRIDGLVNNAGYGVRGPIEIVPVEDIRRNFETNVFSLVALSQLVIPIMRKQGAGRIINISSVAGRIARPLSSVYDSTKHALEALSDGMRGELAPFGIKVVVVEPGFILTEFLQVSSDVSRPVIEKQSPYSGFFTTFNRGADRMRKIAGRPDDIARLVEKALTSARPRIRYAAPAHARIFLALKRMLPDSVIDFAVSRQTGMQGGPPEGGTTNGSAAPTKDQAGKQAEGIR